MAGVVNRGDGITYGGACNLGSLMLHNFVQNPFTDRAQLDEHLLTKTIRTAVRFLDNIIDINNYPDEAFRMYQVTYRTIGLGYTGLADMLVMLGMRYDSEEARKYVDYLCNHIAYIAYDASCDLAYERGSFPGLDREQFLHSGFLAKHEDWLVIETKIAETGIRNARLLAVAPTGTMSLVFGQNCSSGIEPIFSLEYNRDVKLGGQGDDAVKTVTIRDRAYDIAKNCGHVVDFSNFVTALDISVDDHIKMLATIAKHVDMSVSKTINVPEDYPFEDCQDIYVKCWKSNIKGCTIFRPNPLRPGILHTNKDSRGEITHCDDSLRGIKRKLTTGCGSLHLMAWYNSSGNIMEVFLGRGSSGGCEKNLLAMARLISLNLRAGVKLEDVMDQLESCGGCSAYSVRRATKHDTSVGSSCATAIALGLKDIQREIFSMTMDEKPKAHINEFPIREIKPLCPECGSPIVFEGGCQTCKNCGWSKCG